MNNVAKGTALAAQTAGDCKVSQCDGNGGTEVVNADSDVNVDATSCTTDVCTAGVPSNPPVAAGTTCSEGTGALCNGAGACVQCVAATDCPGSDTECQQRTCTAGVCGVAFTAANTPVASQTANDCKKNVCNGAGVVTAANDDADLPNDNNPCTTDTCSAGTAGHTNVSAGQACGTNLVCSGSGTCVGCNTANDCPGSDDACKARTCTAGVCGVSFTAANTLVAAQTPNDCRKNVCDGSGNTVNQNDDADLPADDGNQCTSQTCVSGTPTFPTLPVNTACTQNGGSFCTASGACVACTAASQCPGTDTECEQRTCTNNVCGTTFSPSGTAVSTQTPGDCKENRCDGAGAIVAVNLNTDLPADDGNQCTAQVCAGGAPAFPAVPVNTACTQNGGSFCSATGTCVACTTASQCPGSDTECQQRTCVNNVCGTAFTPSGTAVASQTAGDCKENQCNGAGAIVAVNLNSDLPADDGNQCTAQVCTAGVPSFPVVPVDTACNQNGGSFCSSTGACVACTTASQCPGSDTECQQRTCVNNVCGTSFTPSGTAVASQTAGDCKENQCNGAGAIVAVALNTDLPADDGNQCTAQVCTAGVPTTPTLPVNTACNQNGGSFCSAAGACVACNTASQCPGSDTECQQRTCINNVCGTAFAPSGTAVASQTPGDCKENQCNGAGAIVIANQDADVPADDGNQCTAQVCTAGVPSFANLPSNTACSQNGGSLCDGAGACVGCTTASQCPGSDTECQTRTCNAGVCGSNFVAAGTVTSSQTAGDCKQNECDGSGNIVAIANNADLPADDGNACTAQVCSNGVPTFPFLPVDTACMQNGGSVCSSSGTCVACNVATQCTGSDTECQARTCSAGVCGVSNVAAGVQTSSQLAGDCKVNQCDGNGNIVTVNSSTDVPADDGNQCTDQACNAGVATFPPSAANTACSQNGGSFCDGASACVQCTTATQCPNPANECQTRTCDSNTCGTANVAAGTATQTQTTGDCKQAQCDGSGAIVTVNFDSDLPVDNNQCTLDVCSAGVAANPAAVLGATCSQNGGTVCDGLGTCVSQPTVVSTSPANATTSGTAGTTVAVTFSQAMNPATLTGQSSSGMCSGSVQVSADNFASCMAIGSPVMSGGNTIATFTPAPGLSYGTTYKVRVTTAATNASNVPLASEFTTASGFTTPTDAIVSGVVISQVYGRGGETGSTYAADFVELHNRASTPATLTGWSIQYASATGNFGSASLKIDLPSTLTIPPGGYYLVQLRASGTGTALTPDFGPPSTSIEMGGSGKVALVNSTALLPVSSCAIGHASVVDLIGFGTANCWESTPSGSAAPAQSLTTSSIRKLSGCQDTANSNADFLSLAVSPRRASSTAVVCGTTLNEFNVGEIDYCNVQFPTSMTKPTGTVTDEIFTQIYEFGLTEAVGAGTGLSVQIGYGPTNVNPEYQSGWIWSAATFNTQVDNNDEWKGTFTAPAAGTWNYGARVSLDGFRWTYCDLNGAGSNGGLSFETNQLPVLTVTP